MRRLRIAHLTSVHNLFDSRIFYKECLALAEEGHKVALVAPHDVVSDNHDVASNHGGADAQRVDVYTVPRATGRLQRMTRTVREVYRVATSLDADVYHFHDPELVLAGIFLKLRGKRVVYDAHEDLPRQIYSKHWIPRWLRPLVAFSVGLAERPATAFFDGIVAATPRIARRFPSRKTTTVQNFPRVEELTIAEKPDYLARPPHAVYVGALSEERGVTEMLGAMNNLSKRRPAVLHIAGACVPNHLLDELRRREEWRHVRFHGYISRECVAGLLARARVGLVVLHPEPNYVHAMPVKLFEYMAAGLPVVASDFPLLRRIVEGARCGLLVDPLDPKAIAEAIGWLLQHAEEAFVMGQRGRAAVIEKYNWGGEATKLVDFYRKMNS